MQRTIVIEYNGTPIVSQPFTFKHACIIDDARYKEEGLATGARNAMIKMFEGTVLTEEILDDIDKIDLKVLKKAKNKVIDMYLGIDEEIKNSSSPQPGGQKVVGA
jgi:hypothetical protein